MENILRVIKLVKKVKANDSVNDDVKKTVKYGFQSDSTKKIFMRFVATYIAFKATEVGQEVVVEGPATSEAWQTIDRKAARLNFYGHDSADDSINDALTDEEIDKLIQEEEDAVASYEAALKVAVSPQAKDRLQHILEEEQEHIQELRNLKAQPTHDSNNIFQQYYNKLANLRSKADATKYFNTTTDWPEGVANAKRAGNLTEQEYDKLFDKMIEVCEKYNIEDSVNDAKYTFEYEQYYHDYKTREEDVVKKSTTVNGMSAYDAAKQLPDDIGIIRVYKDNKLLKSFTSKSLGQWHGRGSKEDLKDLEK